MITRANCKHLTYKHSPFFNCTVQEAAFIFFLLFATAFVLSVIMSLFFNLWFVWFLLFLTVIFCGIKPILKYVGRMKEGKQHGYLLMKIKKTLTEKLQLKNRHYVQTKGIWSRRRNHV